MPITEHTKQETTEQPRVNDQDVRDSHLLNRINYIFRRLEDGEIPAHDVGRVWERIIHAAEEAQRRKLFPEILTENELREILKANHVRWKQKEAKRAASNARAELTNIHGDNYAPHRTLPPIVSYNDLPVEDKPAKPKPVKNVVPRPGFRKFDLDL